jgi:hypothetical protein
MPVFGSSGIGLGAARVGLTDLQEQLALKGDEPVSPPPANRKRNNFLPDERECVLFLF